jgi:molecular chaperone GrpE
MVEHNEQTDASNKWQKMADASSDEANPAEGGSHSDETLNPPLDTLMQAIEQKVEHLSKEKAELKSLLEKSEEKLTAALLRINDMERRHGLEVQNIKQFGNENLINQLFPILDALEAGLQQGNQTDSATLRAGTELTLKLFIDTLSKLGVNVIDPMGHAFNPALHEALALQEHPSASPNSIIAVMQKGYQLNGRLIRPAKVILAKPGPSIDTQV